MMQMIAPKAKAVMRMIRGVHLTSQKIQTMITTKAENDATATVEKHMQCVTLDSTSSVRFPEKPAVASDASPQTELMIAR